MAERLSITYLRADELEPYPKNARTHSREQLAIIRRSMLRFGFTVPVCVAGKRIIAGHGRVLAATPAWKDGEEIIGCPNGQVPTVDLSHLSDSERQAYVIADNQIALRAGWDELILAEELRALEAGGMDLADLGFGEHELSSLMRSFNGKDPEETPPVPSDPISQPGDIWACGKHRVMCGNCLDKQTVMAFMEGQKADSVFTSPPYGVGLEYSTYKDSIENLRSILKIAPIIFDKILVQGGFAVVNFADIVAGSEIVGSQSPSEYPMAIEYYPAFISMGWSLWSRRIWCKNLAAMRSTKHCIGTNRSAANFEHIWTFKRRGKPPVDHQITGDFSSQAGFFEVENSDTRQVNENDHPAVMTTGVARRMIAIHCRRGRVCYDPFLGSGTTLIAAEMEGRICYGMEIAPEYVDVAVKRWEQFTGLKAQIIDERAEKPPTSLTEAK